MPVNIVTSALTHLCLATPMFQEKCLKILPRPALSSQFKCSYLTFLKTVRCTHVLGANLVIGHLFLFFFGIRVSCIHHDWLGTLYKDHLVSKFIEICLFLLPECWNEKCSVCVCVCSSLLPILNSGWQTWYVADYPAFNS